MLFFDWLRPLAVNLGGYQDLGTLIAGADQAVKARLIIGGAMGLAILAWVFKSADFRSSRDNILGGLLVGLAVWAAWCVTSPVMVKVARYAHTG